MYAKTFVFQTKTNEKVNTDSRITEVTTNQLYQTNSGFGFVSEQNRNQEELLQLAELNSGFEKSRYTDEETQICADENGCYVNNIGVPLIFKADVTHCGNYLVTVTMYGKGEVLIFSGERRLQLKKCIHENEQVVSEFTTNVCDRIPQGKNCLYENRSIDISIIGTDIRLQKIDIKLQKCPTLYIAGDTNAMDHIAEYPYEAEYSYGGWGQMIPNFLKSGIAVSNHAQANMSMENFKAEGHYANIQAHIRLGDYLMLQFSVSQGYDSDRYKEGLIGYIEEFRAMGVYPILVTPPYENMCDEQKKKQFQICADLCREIGEQYRVPVVDLYVRSKKIMQQLGYEEAAKYYYPESDSDINDCGAYCMAGMIADEYAKMYQNKRKMDAYSKLCGFLIPQTEIEMALKRESLV